MLSCGRASRAQSQSVFDQGRLTLSTLSTRAVFQSSTGHIWIATQDGLNVYDGYRTRVFRPDPNDSTAVSDAYSRVVTEDTQGAIWIGTDTGGLNRYDPTTGIFNAFTTENSGLSNNSVTAIIPREDGSLWVGTQDGLNLLDPVRRSTTVYRADSAGTSGLPNGYISALAVDGNDNLWVGTFGGGLVRFDASSQTFVLVDGDFPNSSAPMDANIVSLHTDFFGDLWVGTWNGLYHMDPDGRSTKHFIHSPDDPTSLPSDLVISILLDSAGYLWVGTVDGLTVRGPSEIGFTTIRSDESVSDGLPGNTVVSIIEDATGVIWIATAGGGVAKTRIERSFLNTFGDARHAPKDVRAILDMGDDRILVGSRHGVDVFSPSDGFSHIADGLPVAFVQDTDGRIWIGGFGGAGILRPDATAIDTLVDTDIYAFHEDAFGRLWLGGSRGIMLSNRDHSSFDAFVPPHALDLDSYVYDIDRLDGRNLLLATKRGIVVFDTETLSFSGPPKPFDDPSLAEDVNAIDWLSDELAALATGSVGLVLVGVDTGELSVITESKGLPSGNVRKTLVADKSIWVHTVEGLCRLDDAATRCTGLDFNLEFRGLIGNSTVLEDGRIAVGADRGLFIFDPHEIENDERPPMTVVSSIAVMDEPYEFSVGGSKGLVLDEPYDRNFLTIGFSALDFTNPDRNRYRYRIGGLIDSWIEHGSEQSVSLSGLAPGSYRFEVLGSNNNGVWSDEPATVAITIRPPFWATWWFRLLVVAIVAGAVFAIYRYRMQKLLEMHRMRIRIADDLHDDIGSRVSSIALMLDYLRNDTEGTGDELRRVSERARDVVDALRETVWVVDAEKDSLTDLVERMKSVSAEICGTRSRFSAPTDLPDRELSMEQRRDLLLMYKEALNNAARHSGGSEIATTVSVERSGLTIEVQDDGVGFDPASVDNGRGLQTLRSRAERSEIELTLHAASGQGTQVSFRLGI